MKYDDEEKFILDALEKDAMQLSDPSKNELKAIKAAARNMGDHKDRPDRKNLPQAQEYLAIF